QSAIAAAQALNQQAGIPFKNIGLTQDIGQADTQDEVTTLANIDTINAFVLSNGLAASRFWSFDRDTPGSCPVGPPSSSTCNGTGNAALAFTHEFMNSLGVQYPTLGRSSDRPKNLNHEGHEGSPLFSVELEKCANSSHSA